MLKIKFYILATSLNLGAFFLTYNNTRKPIVTSTHMLPTTAPRMMTIRI